MKKNGNKSRKYQVLPELYKEIILEHAKNPRNHGVLGQNWKNLEKECQCGRPECDKEFHLYYVLDEIPGGYSLNPFFTTKHHVRFWSGDEIYGPFPLCHG